MTPAEMTPAEHVTDAALPVVVFPPADTPAVSVVIVTYRTGPVVIQALAALRRSTPPDEQPIEVIVVDNSGDGPDVTADLLEQRTRGVRLLRPGANLGFGGGCDLGVAHARADTIALLNPDLIVLPGWLPPLVAALDDPVVAIAAPVLVDPDGAVQEAGWTVLPDGVPVAFGAHVFPDDRSTLFARDVDHASAACWVMRRSDYEHLDGFDPAYHPAYYEDLDLVMRLHAEERVVRLVVDRPVAHLLGKGVDGHRPDPSAGRERFLARWATELEGRPLDWRDPANWYALRDRACVERTVVLASAADLAPAALQALVDESGAAAAASPRDRVTLLIDVLDDEELHRRRWCPLGLELVVGPIEPALRRCAPTATVMHPHGAAATALVAAVSAGVVEAP